jgi:hypothetical protein
MTISSRAHTNQLGPISDFGGQNLTTDTVPTDYTSIDQTIDTTESTQKSQLGYIRIINCLKIWSD